MPYKTWQMLFYTNYYKKTSTHFDIIWHLVMNNWLEFSYTSAECKINTVQSILNNVTKR